MSFAYSYLTLPSQGDIRRHVVGLLYHVAGGRGRLILLPADSPSTEEPGSHVWAEDVETKQWFPRESTRRRISTLPGPAGSPFHLRNHYTILTPRQSTAAPVNQTISANCGLVVRGHVIVLRHAATDRMRITNIQHAERQFIDLMYNGMSINSSYTYCSQESVVTLHPIQMRMTPVPRPSPLRLLR